MLAMQIRHIQHQFRVTSMQQQENFAVRELEPQGAKPKRLDRKPGSIYLSIIVPAYNEAALLDDHLRILHSYMSALDRYVGWESLCVNDGMSDGTAESADEVAGHCGIGRNDILSIQGDFTKGDVLHVYDEDGAEVARGLTNFSSEETMLMARHLDMNVEDVIGYKTKSDVIGIENLLVLEDNHLPLDAPEDDLKVVIPA